MMELEFQMIDEKHIKIIGIHRYTVGGKEIAEKHEVGRIFTPSGSGETTLNAIQVCGFTEAFDLWGCGHYQRPKSHPSKHTMTDVREQLRDIQLQFTWETVKGEWKYSEETCHKCFNNPCTCEIKIKYDNPFTVKTEKDLWTNKVKK